MEENKPKVAVIGLGYVGLTLGTVLAEVGMKVIGLEKRADVVEMTNKGLPHFSETGLVEALSRVVQSGHFKALENLDGSGSCDVYIITVGTPLNADGNARLDMIEAASRQVAEHMSDNSLVILRSTVKIGTAREVVMPILTQSGKNFDIAMCPERTLEGNALVELRQLPQVVGADTQIARDKASALFRTLTNTVVQVSSLEAAELIKLVDNTFRDVQFAFANEIARICDAFELSAHEVISSGKLGYKRTNVPLPGLVGGPCLEKDPHILSQSARKKGIELEITQAARLVNERQPIETTKFVTEELKRRGLANNCKVAILGLAFKGIPETDDLRGTMSIKVIQALNDLHDSPETRLFDPVIHYDVLKKNFPKFTVCRNITEAVAGASVVIIANNHPELGKLKPVDLLEHMNPNGFIYDYWNHFSNLHPSESKGSYYAVGNRGRAVR